MESVEGDNEQDLDESGLSLPKKFEEALEKKDPVLYAKLNSTERVEVFRLASSFVYMERTMHSGPLPDPKTLERYNAIIPNGAERIMSLTESQHKHRMFLESTVIPNQTSESRRGQLFGFIIGMTCVIGAVICILMGHEVSGAIFGTGGITGLVSVFVVGSIKSRKDLERKDPD